MEDRIVELEKKISFLEHFLEEVQEVVFDQQKKINELFDQMDVFKAHMNNESLVKSCEDEDLPPHY